MKYEKTSSFGTSLALAVLVSLGYAKLVAMTVVAVFAVHK